MIKRATVCGVAVALILSTVAAGFAADKKLYGGLDQWAAVCNAAGIKLKGAQIEKVMLGTPAYFTGLRDGDKVLKCDIGDKSMKILFERGGAKYAVVVPTDAAALQPEVAVKVPVHPKFNIGEKEAMQTLRDYDVIIFLDCSGSMGEGIRSENMRKWDWASRNIRDFNGKFNDAVKRNITLVTFNDKFKVMPNCTPADLESVFAHREPEGGTDLAQPLESIIDERLRELEKRPCVIVVLHDGINDNEDRVQRILERTARQLFSPGKIFITFIQIGDDPAGSENLKEMEAVNVGGKELVKAELFDDIRKTGLANVIAQAIHDHVPTPAPVPVNKPAVKPALKPAAKK
jgi:hypothetical protein